MKDFKFAKGFQDQNNTGFIGKESVPYLSHFVTHSTDFSKVFHNACLGYGLVKIEKF